jgi:acyl-CoA dehydrogenase
VQSLLIFLCFVGAVLTLFYQRASLKVWTVSACVGLLFYTHYASSYFLLALTWLLALVLFIPLNLTSMRRQYLSEKAFALYKKMMPKMSNTEKEALEAGTITWEGDLFSGSPDFSSLLKRSQGSLNNEERDFLDNKVSALCHLIDEWQVTHHDLDLSPEAWSYIKNNGFLGMIIPKKYGGLQFSASAQAAVLIKIYSKSVTGGTTVSVPNSLGPGELLLKYGTKEQKDYYLPRLAKGLDVPCFALTGPNAGSDAASIPDSGVVCRGDFNGEQVLGIRLNWDKRYITLAPVATLLGLAFRLFDPEGLLGDKKDIGITCGLIPVETKGVVIGRRHFPLNTGFMNGPTQGKDVFVPLDYVIGGAAMVGQGWRMLMECLSAGRGISLPSSAVGGSQMAALVSGAYTRVRSQFNTAISNFEGIEEPLARIAGLTYINNAALYMTVASIDSGEKPAVASAIIKYHTTENARLQSIDAMDIHGGKGICLGPNNYLGRGYQNAPISITVEGANILTRCLIIFGQGAIRCHPYVLKELQSAEQNDLKAFDNALFKHIGHFFSNAVRSLVLGATDGRVMMYHKDKLKRPIQLMTRYSAHLAFLADFSMIVLGADLKRKEKISGRLGDILSLLYLSSAVIKRFHDDGRPNEDWPLVEWSYQYLLHQAEEKMKGLVMNFPSRASRVVLKVLLFPSGMKRHAPSDALGKKLATILTTDNASRKRLTKYAFVEPGDTNPVAELEDAFQQVIQTASLEKRVLRATKKGELCNLTLLDNIDEAEKKTLLSKEEAKLLRQAEQARQRVIAVDDFSSEELKGKNSITSEKKVFKAVKNEKRNVS